MGLRCLFGHKYISVRDVNHELCGGCYTEPDKIYNPKLKPKYPKGYCPHSFEVCKRCGKERGFGSHGELTVIPDGCKRQINKMKENFMKTVLMAVLAVLLFAGNLMAQATPQPAQGLNFGFAIGQDNAWLFSPGSKSGFFVVGAGIDIANYTQKLSKTGSTLVLSLHGTMLSPVTGNDRKPIFGAGINLDIMQLINGTKIKILIDNLSVVVGPITAYDTGLGKPVYGGLANVNFKF